MRMSEEEYAALIGKRLSKKPAAGPKYSNEKEEVDGIVFHSKKEARRYRDLKVMERLKEIESIELQPKFPVYINDKKVFLYTADFRYRVVGGDEVVEDVKGVRTPVYRIKKRCVEAYYGITIKEL